MNDVFAYNYLYLFNFDFYLERTPGQFVDKSLYFRLDEPKEVVKIKLKSYANIFTSKRKAHAGHDLAHSFLC